VGQAAAVGHLLGEVGELVGGEELAGEGEELAVFDVDVAAVELAEVVEGLGELAGLRGGEGAEVEPAAEPEVDLGVGEVGGGVFVFEGFDGGEGGLGGGVAGGAEEGEEGFLLVGGVARGGDLEVLEGDFDGAALFVVEGLAIGLFADFLEDGQEVLDAAVAVAEQAEGLVKSVFGAGTEFDGHVVYL
jgi:hypothetical protein